MKRIKYLDDVPQYLQQQINEGLFGAPSEIIKRLVSEQEMIPTWQFIQQVAHEQPTLADDLLDLCETLPYHWDAVVKTPASEMRETFDKLASLAQSLASLLQDNEQIIVHKLKRGLRLEDLIRISLPTRRASHGLKADALDVQYDIPVDARYSKWMGRPLLPSVVSILDSFAMVMRALAAAPDGRGKLRSSGGPSPFDPGRTFFVREVARFFESRTGKPQFSLVAAVVNMIRDKHGELDASWVRKLVV